MVLKNIETVVILGAGRGSRMGCETYPKVMTMVNNKPLINHVADYWLKHGCKNIIFVLGYKYEMVIEAISKYPSYKIIIQDKLDGIANAVLLAEEYIDDKFVVALGDCLNNGEFSHPLDVGCGTWINCYLYEELVKSYAVFINEDKIYKVIEKPKLCDEIYNVYCGMGTYFLDKRVFEYIRKTEPSTMRNEVEITSVIQKMIDGGIELKPIYFKGDYINVTTLDDIKKAEEIIK